MLYTYKNEILAVTDEDKEGKRDTERVKLCDIEDVMDASIVSDGVIDKDMLSDFVQDSEKDDVELDDAEKLSVSEMELLALLELEKDADILLDSVLEFEFENVCVADEDLEGDSVEDLLAASLFVLVRVEVGVIDVTKLSVGL